MIENIGVLRGLRRRLCEGNVEGCKWVWILGCVAMDANIFLPVPVFFETRERFCEPRSHFEEVSSPVSLFQEL